MRFCFLNKSWIFSLVDSSPNPIVSRFPRRCVSIAKPIPAWSRNPSSKSGATGPPNSGKPQRLPHPRLMMSRPSLSSKENQALHILLTNASTPWYYPTTFFDNAALCKSAQHKTTKPFFSRSLVDVIALLTKVLYRLSFFLFLSYWKSQ